MSIIEALSFHKGSKVQFEGLDLGTCFWSYEGLNPAGKMHQTNESKTTVKFVYFMMKIIFFNTSSNILGNIFENTK